ncbi:unnamed protein product, partial [Ectocarpus sp. 8 AP-2014]
QLYNARCRSFPRHLELTGGTFSFLRAFFGHQSININRTGETIPFQSILQLSPRSPSTQMAASSASKSGSSSGL